MTISIMPHFLVCIKRSYMPFQVAIIACHAASGNVVVGLHDGHIEFWQTDPSIAPAPQAAANAAGKEKVAEKTAREAEKKAPIVVQREGVHCCYSARVLCCFSDTVCVAAVYVCDFPRRQFRCIKRTLRFPQDHQSGHAAMRVLRAQKFHCTHTLVLFCSDHCIQGISCVVARREAAYLPGIPRE